MNKEIKSIVKKTAKIVAVTCVAAGAVALVTTDAALKALTEGAKYLKDTVKKIVGEQPESVVEEPTADPIAEETPAAEPVVAEVVEAPVAEAVAEDADFAEGESQEA